MCAASVQRAPSSRSNVALATTSLTRLALLVSMVIGLGLILYIGFSVFERAHRAQRHAPCTLGSVGAL